MKKYEITKKGGLVAGPIEAADANQAEAKARLMGIKGVITVSETQTEAHTPTPQIVSEFFRNLAVNTIDDKELKNRLHEMADIVYSWRNAVNAYDEDQRKIATLLEAAKRSLAWFKKVPVYIDRSVHKSMPICELEEAIAQAEARS